MGYTTENNKYVNSNESIIFDDFTLDTKFVDFPYMVKSSAIKILTLKDEKKDNIRFNFELLSNHRFNMLGHARHYISVVQPEEVFTTNKHEQDKIGELFTNLDNLITLHQRKFNYIFARNLEIKLFFFKITKNVWEQRKLGDISIIVGGGTPSTEVESYWNGNINWYSPAEIGSQIYVSNSQRKITELGLEKSSARLLPVGTVLFTSRAGIGNMAILKEKACTNQGFQSIIPIKNKLNSYFIFSRSNELKKYAETVGAGSTFVEVSGKQMSEMEIKIPQIKEQLKMGTLFESIDNLITLHQRKYVTIFYSWEQRKLGDISIIVGGGTPSTEVESYWNGNINWYSPAEIGSQIYVSNSQRKITELGLEKSSARLLPVGTVLFTSRAGIGNMAILKEKACTNQGFQSIIPIKNKLNSYFIFSRSNELKKYAETVGAGSTFVEVSGKQMSEMEIKIPQIKEQLKMGTLFESIDNLITLHQHKELKRRNDNNEHLRW